MRWTANLAFTLLLCLTTIVVFSGCGGTSVSEPSPSSNPATTLKEPSTTTGGVEATTTIVGKSTGTTMTTRVASDADTTVPADASSTTTVPVSPPSTSAVPPAVTTTTEVVTLEPGEAPQTGFVSVEPEAA